MVRTYGKNWSVRGDGGYTAGHDGDAKACGMDPLHAQRLRDFCKARGLLIIVRASKPESIQWQSQQWAKPKPVTVKDKTGANGALVHRGKLYYSDYDLQGVYQRDANGRYVSFCSGNYFPVGPDRVKNDKFLRELNHAVCGDGPNMFQHGANDEYLKGGGGPGRHPEANERFLVTQPDGDMLVIRSTSELQQYYVRNGLPWMYGTYSAFGRS